MPTTITRSDLLTTIQAGKALGYTRQHIRWLVIRGELAATIVGNRYLISNADIEAFRRRREEARRTYTTS